MTMYPTAHLEHHADLFAANLMHKHGLTLDQYLADPARYQHLVEAPFPLLPDQTKVRVRLIRDEINQQTTQALEDELDGLPRQNVTPFEPMRHHRHPKRRGFASCFRRRPKPQTI